MEYSSFHGMADGLRNIAIVATCPRLGHDHSTVDREGFMRPYPFPEELEAVNSGWDTES